MRHDPLDAGITACIGPGLDSDRSVRVGGGWG